MKYAIEMALCGMIYLRSFMMIGTGVLAILRFCLRNLRGCNVGITDGRDLRIKPSFIKIGSEMQKLLWGATHTDTQTAR
jgi:hypothetical protein